MKHFVPRKEHYRYFKIRKAIQIKQRGICYNMANKENYSVKAEIEKALLKLLTQKEYTDITITDVVKEAKVALVSFYRNFSSIADILESIAEQTIQKFNIELSPLIDTGDERNLREFLFNCFYQISLNHEEMWALGSINSNTFSSYLSAKFEHSFPVSDSSNLTISQKYDWVAKLCLLDGIARKWIMDGLQESPEKMIDYVMPVIQML